MSITQHNAAGLTGKGKLFRCMDCKLCGFLTTHSTALVRIFSHNIDVAYAKIASCMGAKLKLVQLS